MRLYVRGKGQIRPVRHGSTSLTTGGSTLRLSRLRSGQVRSGQIRSPQDAQGKEIENRESRILDYPIKLGNDPSSLTLRLCSVRALRRAGTSSLDYDAAGTSTVLSAGTTDPGRGKFHKLITRVYF